MDTPQYGRYKVEPHPDEKIDYWYVKRPSLLEGMSDYIIAICHTQADGVEVARGLALLDEQREVLNQALKRRATDGGASANGQ